MKRFLKRLKSRFLKGNGFDASPHKIKIVLSRYCYLKPTVTGVVGSWWDHPFPDANHIDWEKNPYRIQPYEEIWFFWLWIRVYIKIGHFKSYQANQDVAKRNALKAGEKQSVPNYCEN